MIRKIVLSMVAVVALTFAGFAPAASAETPTPVPTAGQCEYSNEIAFNCAGQADGYPEGGFGSGAAKPTATPKPRPTATPAVVADDATATSGGGGTSGGASIAFTGSESRVLGYVGAGMIGFGAVALAAARRRNDNSLD